MEEVLFQIMHGRGFTDTYVRRFRMVTRFHLQRRPLVIFISGTACTGFVGFRGHCFSVYGGWTSWLMMSRRTCTMLWKSMHGSCEDACR